MDNLMMVEINSSEDWVVLDFTFPTKVRPFHACMHACIRAYDDTYTPNGHQPQTQAVEADDEDGFFAAAASSPALRGTAEQGGEGDSGKAMSGTQKRGQTDLWSD